MLRGRQGPVAIGGPRLTAGVLAVTIVLLLVISALLSSSLLSG